MNFTVDMPVHILRGLLVFARLSGFVFAAPVYQMPQISRRWQTAFVVILTLSLTPVLPTAWSTGALADVGTMQYIWMLLCEALFGLVVMLICRMLMETLAIAGFMVDRGMGFALARVFSPNAGGQRTLMSALFVQLFVVVFLVINAHHDVIRLVVLSFHHVGPGTFMVNQGTTDGLIEIGSRMFRDGFIISLPIFVMVMCVNTVMALVTRFGQEFKVMMLSFPLRLGLGFVVLLSFVPLLIHLIRLLAEGMIMDLQRLIVG